VRRGVAARPEHIATAGAGARALAARTGCPHGGTAAIIRAMNPNRSVRPRWLPFAQIALPAALLLLWHVLVKTEVLPAFFFGEPLVVLERIGDWFTSGSIWPHLGVTLLETVLAFAIGTVGGLGFGLWLGLSDGAAALLDPYIKGLNAMPRVILAPIFAVWFGLGVWSKVLLGVTLVFFIVFFSVYHGVREVNRNVLDNARMLGATRRQLLRHVYLPSATAWVFASLHSAVGMAFVGAVVGEYLGSASGVGYLILQAEGVFDINSVFAGVLVLTACALVLDGLVTLAERRLLRWRPGRSAGVA
jgi:NitT/TauT family transport system permease protein